MERGAVAEINLNAIAANLRTAKKIARDRAIIAVVKADAYGHGAFAVSSRLVKAGVSHLAVAYTSEGVALRKSGIKTPIIVLFDKENLEDYFMHRLTPVIHDIRTARAFSKEAGRRRKIIRVHVKTDTGMGRLGFTPSDAVEKISAVAKMDFIKLAGLMSHFSDADLSDRSYAVAQIKKFKSIKDALIKKGIDPGMCHMANSAATLSLNEAHFDGIRPGLMLYGYSPFIKQQGPRGLASGESPRRQGVKGSGKNILLEPSNPQTLEPLLQPAMTVKTKILSLRKVRKDTPISYGRSFITKRESIIGVLPIGYADGYFRAFSNNSDVLVRGKRAPVVGRVCMDTTMIDATDINGVSESDEVVLLGRQKKDIITATELAAKAGTISYEILTSFGNKSRKVYT